MGEIPNSKRTHNSTTDYYVNEDGSVTKKTVTKPRSQTSSFTINEDGSVTKRSAMTKHSINQNRSAKRVNCKSEPIKDRSTVYPIGITIHVVATIIFLILMIVNTTDTFGGYVEACLGLSLFSVFLYHIVTRPILNWLSGL